MSSVAKKYDIVFVEKAMERARFSRSYRSDAVGGLDQLAFRRAFVQLRGRDPSRTGEVSYADENKLGGLWALGARPINRSSAPSQSIEEIGAPLGQPREPASRDARLSGRAGAGLRSANAKNC